MAPQFTYFWEKTVWNHPVVCINYLVANTLGRNGLKSSSCLYQLSGCKHIGKKLSEIIQSSVSIIWLQTHWEETVWNHPVVCINYLVANTLEETVWNHPVVCINYLVANTLGRNCLKSPSRLYQLSGCKHIGKKLSEIIQSSVSII